MWEPLDSRHSFCAGEIRKKGPCKSEADLHGPLSPRKSVESIGGHTLSTRALVTGASGFLGGRLAQVLAERGEQVRVLARRTSDLTHLEGLPIEIAYGDLAEAETLPPAVA